MNRLAALLLFACSCGWDSGVVDVGSGLATGPIPVRHMSVASDGCTLEPWGVSTLDGAAAKKVLSEVVLLCAVPRAIGTVGPGDASARAALGAQLGWLRQRGYRPILGVDFTDETGARYDGAQALALLSNGMWRASVIADLLVLGNAADGFEIDFQSLPNDARVSVTTFAHELAIAAHANKKTVGILLPPSTAVPSDIPGGDAFDLVELAADMDRMRIMTLDFSDKGPGPTMDTGWAVDAVRFARDHGAKRVDVAYPLYGVDFSGVGRRLVSTPEAWGLASLHHRELERAPNGAPHFSFQADDGHHDVWFDDVVSTSSGLRAWDASVLPLDVGIFFYGLGAQDPRLFTALAAALP